MTLESFVGSLEFMGVAEDVIVAALQSAGPKDDGSGFIQALLDAGVDQSMIDAASAPDDTPVVMPQSLPGDGSGAGSADNGFGSGGGSGAPPYDPNAGQPTTGYTPPPLPGVPLSYVQAISTPDLLPSQQLSSYAVAQSHHLGGAVAGGTRVPSLTAADAIVSQHLPALGTAQQLIDQHIPGAAVGRHIVAKHKLNKRSL